MYETVYANLCHEVDNRARLMRGQQTANQRSINDVVLHTQAEFRPAG